MTADPKALAARLRERVAAVGEVVSAINNGTTRWRMSVPVQDDDPDMVIGSLMSAASAAADALDATPASATNERGLDGWWPKTDLRRAFLDGAKWWEYVSRHGTMWQSDQNRAAAEAERRYPNGVYDPTPAPASADAAPNGLLDRLADLLTRTANALKGEPAPLTLHDWSDLPEVAARLRASADATPVAAGVAEARAQASVNLIAAVVEYEKQWDDASSERLTAAFSAYDAAVRAERAPEDEKEFGLRVCEAYGGDPSQVEWHSAEGVASILNEITGIGRANFVEGWNAAMTTAPDEVKAAATRVIEQADDCDREMSCQSGDHAVQVSDLRTLARHVLGGGA